MNQKENLIKATGELLKRIESERSLEMLFHLSQWIVESERREQTEK